MFVVPGREPLLCWCSRTFISLCTLCQICMYFWTFFTFFFWSKEYNFIWKARRPRRWQASAAEYHLIWVWMPVSFIDRRVGDEESESESDVAQSSPTLCDPMDCSLPGSSVHGIFQARVLEWTSFNSYWFNDLKSIGRIISNFRNLEFNLEL